MKRASIKEMGSIPQRIKPPNKATKIKYDKDGKLLWQNRYEYGINKEMLMNEILNGTMQKLGELFESDD